jgi:tRNA threonylcarbamoyladenosine biosynthesis protein TsaE
MPAVYHTRSEEETIALGRRLAAEWPPPGVMLLIGELGAGKTTLAKGVASALGAAAPEDVSSPTFPLIHEYGEPPLVYHIDLYRLDTLEETASLGLGDIFARPALVLLEWAERFPSLLPVPRREVRLEALGGNERRVTVTDILE